MDFPDRVTNVIKNYTELQEFYNRAELSNILEYTESKIMEYNKDFMKIFKSEIIQFYFVTKYKYCSSIFAIKKFMSSFTKEFKKGMNLSFRSPILIELSQGESVSCILSKNFLGKEYVMISKLTNGIIIDEKVSSEEEFYDFINQLKRNEQVLEEV